MRTCSIEGCDRKHASHGYCNMHSLRERRHGDPQKTLLKYHGLWKSPEWRTWHSIKTRINCPKQRDKERYGDRGIKICERWEHSFQAFYSDMGPKPGKRYQIDRIDNDGDYEPGNCRWATCEENSQNKTNTKLSPEKVKAIRGKSAHRENVNELAARYNVSQETIRDVAVHKTWRNI